MTTFNENWEVEQGEEIRAELEAEIKQELAILNSRKYGNKKSDLRRRCMIRHHITKLENARELYAKLFGKCEF